MRAITGKLFALALAVAFIFSSNIYSPNFITSAESSSQQKEPPQQQTQQDSDRAMMLAHLLYQQLPKELVEAEEFGAVGVVQRLLAIIALFDHLTRFAAALGMHQQTLADQCRAAEPKLDFAFNFITENR